MKIYESPYLVIEYIEEGNYQINTWLPNSKNLDDAIFKTEVSEQAKVALEKNIVAFVTDTTSLFFTIHPEVQKWVNEIIFKKMCEAGVKKLALLSSSDLVTQLSVEQLVDDYTLKGFAIEFFDDTEKAKEWILSPMEKLSPIL